MNYHNIERGNMLNGDGIRCVLWVSGCSHNCEGCQNPQTHDPNSGILFDDNAKNEIFEILGDKYISGITFSGGDPLFHSNIDTIVELVKEIVDRFPGKTIWVYTGYTFETLIDMSKHNSCIDYLLHNIDVLVDGRYDTKLCSVEYHWAGSTNQRVIDCMKSMECGEIILHEK